MNELLRETLAEGVECLAALDGELARLERDPHDATAVAGAFRQLHTVKGSCACVRLERIGRLAHAAEDALAALRIEGGPATPRAVAALRLAAGRVRAVMLELAATGHEPTGDDADVTAALAAAVSGASPEPVAPPVPSLFGNLVRDLAGIRDRLLAQPSWKASGGELRRLDDVVAGLQRVAPRLHWRPLGPTLESLGRVVADLAAELGKRAELIVEGGDVDVDPRVLARLRPALIHLLRNAVDHGIETPRERLRAGKPIVGRVTVGVSAHADMLSVRVADDGRGIDVAALRRRLAASGEADASGLDDAAVRAQVFQPGVTSLDAPTALSGRGVGLDAVRTSLAEAGGTIEIEAVAGGTAFVLSLPLAGEAPAGSRTVLVVNDDPFSRRVIAPLLAAAGCRVVVAEDGDKARALIETGGRFDTVISAGATWNLPSAAQAAAR